MSTCDQVFKQNHRIVSSLTPRSGNKLLCSRCVGAVEHCSNAMRECSRVIGRDQFGVLRLRDLADAADIGGDERRTAGDRFSQNIRQAFRLAAQHREVGRPIPVSESVMSHRPYELNEVSDPFGFGQLLPLGTAGAIAQQTESDWLSLIPEDTARPDQDFDLFHVDESTDPDGKFLANVEMEAES